MKCGKCQEAEMALENFGGIEIDRCPKCRGLFLDRGELEKLLAQDLGYDADTPDFSIHSEKMNEQSADCGRCGQRMEPLVPLEGVKVDFCRPCGGVFLDEGELAAFQFYTS